MHTSMLLLDYLLPINLIIFSDRPDKNNQRVKMALQPTMDAPDFKGENFLSFFAVGTVATLYVISHFRLGRNSCST